MAKLRYDNGALEWRIECPEHISIPMDDPTLVRFVNTIISFNQKVSLRVFRSELLSGNPSVYSYVFETVAGRRWEQQLKFEDTVTQNFDVPDFWNEETEFSFHREVRRTLIELIQTYGVTFVKFEWV